MTVGEGVKVCVAVAVKVAVDVCVKVGVKVKVAVFVNVGVDVWKNSPALVSTTKYKMMTAAKTIPAKTRIRLDIVFSNLHHRLVVRNCQHIQRHLRRQILRHRYYRHHYYPSAFSLARAG